MSYTVKRMLEQWLKEHDYDGLVNLKEGCGCCFGSMFLWCNEIREECEAAWKMYPASQFTSKEKVKIYHFAREINRKKGKRDESIKD